MNARIDPTAVPPLPLRSQTLGMGELHPSDEVRILVIDDDPSVCALMKATLARPEFKVDVLSDPYRIERLLKEAKPDAAGGPADYHVIILDYVLPGTQPEEVLGWVREHQPDASVIVVTGHPSVESVLNCLRARTYDYLTKPVQVQQLREVVTRCLESKGLLRMTEKALRESLGLAIRERRKAMDLTLAKMADRTGVSLGYLSQIELGKNSASIETLYRICLALGIRMADLFQAVQQKTP